MAGKTPVQPLALLEAIGAMLPKDAVVIEEVLSSAPGVRIADQQRRPQSFFGAARRRHRLGPAGRDRRQARAAGPAGGGADRRRQRDVHDAGAVDRGALQAAGDLGDLQQHQLPHPQAAAGRRCAGSPSRPTTSSAWS